MFESSRNHSCRFDAVALVTVSVVAPGVLFAAYQISTMSIAFEAGAFAET